MTSFNFSTFTNATKSFDWEEFLHKANPQNDPSYWKEKITKNTIVIMLYSLIFIVSLFGNILVCYVIFSNRQMKTVINYYIANLTISDIMMTVINIPFSIARQLSDNWPFGFVLCKFVPFVQVNSV
jgi:hypothetical protein